MKSIYFAGSIRGGREDAALYQRLIEGLSAFSKVLTEHIGQKDLSAAGEKGMTDREIYDRDMAWLLSADAVVAEVTAVSLGVGYELGCAVQRGIPVIALYRAQPGKRLSAMIAGCPEIRVIPWSEETMEETLRQIRLLIEG